jgi:PAS domain S-box-containing protein
VTVFNALLNVQHSGLPVIQCTQSTLIHLSNTLIDIARQRELPVVILKGFAPLLPWEYEREQYRALRAVAQKMVLLSSDPSPPFDEDAVTVISLKQPIRDEYLFVLLSTPFSALLSARKHQQVEDDPVFELVWSFSPPVIQQALEALEQVLSPETYPLGRADCSVHTLQETAPEITTAFITEILRYQERLNREVVANQQMLLTLNESLKTSREHYRLVAETANEIILTIDEQGTIQYINQAVEKLLGFAPEALIGQPMSIILCDFDLHLHRLFEMYQRDDGSMFMEDVVESCALHRTGEIIPIDMSCSGFLQDNQRVFVCIIRDIRERMRAEYAVLEYERMRVALEKEHELSELRNHFLSMLSHEFRTPLSVILTSSEMVERYYDRMTPERRGESFNRIRQQVIYLTGLLDDMRLTVSLSSGSFPLEPQTMRPDEFCRTVAQEAIASMGGDHALVYSFAGSTPTFTTDYKLLRRMIANLISNAIKFSAQGSQIDFEMAWDEQEARLVIRDHGSGIDGEDHERVFDLFYRGKNAAYTGGAGVGLKIVWECVRMMGGQIHFETEMGQGTSFFITLPMMSLP